MFISQIVVTVVAVVFFAVNIYAVTQLEQDFDPRSFIPDDSYASDYFDASDFYFPTGGAFVDVFLGKCKLRFKFKIKFMNHKSTCQIDFID